MSKGKHKFVFSEIFNNKDGKTSGSGFAGVIICLVGSIAILASIGALFMKIPDTIPFMQQIMFFVGLGTVLLGARKFVSKNEKSTFESESESESKNDDSDIKI